jgi:hypothetical protein
MDTRTMKTVTALSRRVVRLVPKNWCKSELTKFLDAAEEQAHATYAVMPEWVEALEAVDKALVEGSITFFHEIDPSRQTTAQLFMRAFGTYRAAAWLAISGQLFETTILIRSIVESSVYAWACSHSPDHRTKWDERSQGVPEKNKAREAFRWGSLMGMVKTKDPRLAERISKLYEQVIETGAHPNVDGIQLSSETRQIADERFEISTIFLHGDEAVLIGLLNLLRAMELSYWLLDLTIHDRLRILGIDQQVKSDNERVVKLIEDLERRQERNPQE